jgi:hypothetical protein
VTDAVALPVPTTTLQGDAALALDTAAVESAVTLALRAPSIHNTQPWRFEFSGGVLCLRADRSRQLGIADPDGHSLMISCGAVLGLTESALRADGWIIDVRRMPDPADPDLLAELRAVERREPTQLDLDRVAASQRRRSERRPFAAGPAREDLVDRLRKVTAAPEVYAAFPSQAEHRVGLAVAVSFADRFQRRDADYLAEMARWTRRDSEAPDGVPPSVIPHLPVGHVRHTDIPLRDFEAGVPGAQLVDPGIDEQPLIAVVFTTSDRASDRLRAGEAMMRLMIEAETVGLASCALSQAVDMLAFRVRLQTLMNWTDHPQMMLRLGYPPLGVPAQLTPRRALSEVLKNLSR